MKPLLRTVVVSAIAAIASFAIVALVIVWIGGDGGSRSADVAEDAYGVDAIVAQPRSEGVAVTGFLFVGRERSVLCSNRTTEDPPFCDQTAIEVVGLDPSRVVLETPADSPAYSPDEVTLFGDYASGRLTVREVLAG